MSEQSGYFTESLKPKKSKLSFIEKMKIRLKVLETIKHSHARENARRVRQIERGIIKVG